MENSKADFELEPCSSQSNKRQSVGTGSVAHELNTGPERRHLCINASALHLLQHHLYYLLAKQGEAQAGHIRLFRATCWGNREGSSEKLWPLKGSVSEGLHRKRALQDRSSGVGRSPLRMTANAQPLVEECLSERAPRQNGVPRAAWPRGPGGSHKGTT